MSEKDVVENVDSPGEISIPIANNDTPGIASFDSNDFTVGTNGKVSSIVERGIPQYLGKITGTGTGTTDLNWEVDTNTVKQNKPIKLGEYIMLTAHFNQFVPGDIFRITSVQIEGSKYTVKTNNVRVLSLASIVGPQGEQGNEGPQGVPYLAYTNSIESTVDPVLDSIMHLEDGHFNRTPIINAGEYQDVVTVDWYNTTTHRAFMVTCIIQGRDSSIVNNPWVAQISAATDITGAVGPQGKEGAGIADIVDIDYPHGEFTSVQYDTTDGIKMQGIAEYLRDDGETYQIPTDIDVPLVAGPGLSMDKKATEEKVEIKSLNSNLKNGRGNGSIILVSGYNDDGEKEFVVCLGGSHHATLDYQILLGPRGNDSAEYIIAYGSGDILDPRNLFAVRRNGSIECGEPENSGCAVRLKELNDALYPIIETSYNTNLLKSDNVNKYYVFSNSVTTNSNYWIDSDNTSVPIGTVVKVVQITDSHTGNPTYFFKIVGIDERELYLTNGQGKCSIVKKAYGTDVTPKATGYYSNVFSVDTDNQFGGQAAAKYTTLFGANVRADIHAEGSIVGGRYCIVDSPYTLAYGRSITTQANQETITKVLFGYNNKFNTKAILEVGNGTDDVKSNAFEILKDGRAKVQTAPIENNDVPRLAELNNKVDISENFVKAFTIPNGASSGTLTADVKQKLCNPDGHNYYVYDDTSQIILKYSFNADDEIIQYKAVYIQNNTAYDITMQILTSNGSWRRSQTVLNGANGGEAVTPSTATSTATSGTFTSAEWAKLQANDNNYILFNNEIYRLADKAHAGTTGIWSYTHTGWDGTAIMDKSINVTVSTGAWTLVVGQASAGGKLYQHSISFDDENLSITFDFIDNNKTKYTPQTLKVPSSWNSIKLYLKVGAGSPDKQGFGYIESISDGHCAYAGIYVATWSGVPLSTAEIVSGYGRSMSTNFADTLTEL